MTQSFIFKMDLIIEETLTVNYNLIKAIILILAIALISFWLSDILTITFIKALIKKLGGEYVT